MGLHPRTPLGWGVTVSSAPIASMKEADMAEAKTAVANKPAWVDLATSDATAAREFYSKLFGWKIEVNPDPQYGGDGVGENGGKTGAGGGAQKSSGTPPAREGFICTTVTRNTCTEEVAGSGR